MSALQVASTKLLDLENRILGVERSNEESNNEDLSKTSMKCYYWGIKNRGNFVRFILSAAGITFEDIMDKNLIEANCLCRNKINENDRRFNAFAPPFVEHNGNIVAQTVPIQQYIADISGLRPKSALDNAFCSMILENTTDIQSEFYKQTGKEDKEFLEFLNGRFQTWLNTLSKPLTKNKNNEIYYFENRITVADTSVAALMDGLNELFGKNFDKFVTRNHPSLAKLYENVIEQPRIKELLKRQEKAGLQFFYDSTFKDMKQQILRL